MEYTWLRKYGLKTRMSIAFIIIPCLLMAILFAFYYYMSVNIILDKSYQSSNKLLSLSEENIYLNSLKIEEQFHRLEADISFHKIINEQDIGLGEYLRGYMCDGYYIDGLSDFHLYNLELQDVYHLRNNAYDIEQLLDENIFYGNCFWEYLPQLEQVVMVQKVHDQGNAVGYAVCVFPQASWNTHIREVDTDEDLLVLVDRDGRSLFGSKYVPYNTNLAGGNQLSFSGQKFYKNSKNIRGIDWKLVHLMGKNHIFSELYNFRNMVLIFALIMLIILHLIAFVIYHSIFDPMNNILKLMNNSDESRLLNERVQDSGKDEMHYLATNYNTLLDRIEDLVATVELEQEQKRVTQFQLLQAQINPHFLFNTLNTLHFLAIMNEDKPVSEGIHALAMLLRNTISEQKEVVSVLEEIENIKNYIIIQKLRYGDLFETMYQIDEEVYDCQILKLILQPIVENSILHAFEEDKENQILKIKIQRENEFLKIEISDNGKGFVCEKRKPKGSLSGIGIDNISERITLMYGKKYSMSINSEVGKGTNVVLLLPFIKGEAACTKL